jgi:hypothetical protein
MTTLSNAPALSLASRGPSFVTTSGSVPFTAAMSWNRLKV